MSIQAEVLQSIAPDVDLLTTNILRQVDDDANWQPTDLLPDPATEEGYAEVQTLRSAAAELSDELVLVTVGNLITEEALPTYQTAFNRHPGVNDITGTDDTPWAKWSRGWTAEEKRHGAVMSMWARYSGRIDMRAVEATIQYLIGNGFDARTGNDPYEVLVFTSFQEHATLVSHKNVAQQAGAAGDAILQNICDLVGTDEARHARFYKSAARLIFSADPDGALIALANMMKKKIGMPAQTMYDGRNSNLFMDFSEIAQQIGVYTTDKYAEIMELCNQFWNVESLSPHSDAAKKAQDYVTSLPDRYRKLALRRKPADIPMSNFSWLVRA
jgi:acyl-[acyl-carrier-protein] desaturase